MYKEKILETIREKQLMCKGSGIRRIAAFSTTHQILEGTTDVSSKY